MQYVFSCFAAKSLPSNGIVIVCKRFSNASNVFYEIPLCCLRLRTFSAIVWLFPNVDLRMIHLILMHFRMLMVSISCNHFNGQLCYAPHHTHSIAVLCVDIYSECKFWKL